MGWRGAADSADARQPVMVWIHGVKASRQGSLKVVSLAIRNLLFCVVRSSLRWSDHRGGFQ